ncbi:MAG: hypothetical protein MJZ34_02785 [Paludibacteraceae bacterium]|nr:hypothetical protein [Paludibacteraceae bacterium]
MITRDADLIVRMIDFTKPGVGTNQFMSKDSFIENVINNDYHKKRLKNGMLKCLLTHQGRDFADNNRTGTPYDDILATHPDMCGVMRDVWIEGDSAYAAIDLFDPVAFPAAGKVKELIKKGTYVGVSMATESIEGPQGNYEIKELIGCDFTLDNFFIGSGIVTIKKNFSRGKNGSIIMNFSNTPDKERSSIIKDNFSLREIIRESKMPYYMVLSKRIVEAITVLKNLSPELIKKSAPQIKAYINDMIYNWTADALVNPGRINIALGLRINRYLENPQIASSFNQRINMIKNTYSRMGFLSKVHQANLNTLMEELLDSLWSFICKKAGIDKTLLAGVNPTEK